MAKMPILKQLVTNPNASKRRSRADLTAEMISAPLGDFRHTMHIGRSGDAFGDTSFLSKEETPEPEESTSKPGLLSRHFRSSKRSLSVTRGERRDMLGSLRDSALFVKNAVSLPQLTEKESDRGSSSKKMPKSLSSSPVKKMPEEQQHINGASARSPIPSPVPMSDTSLAEKEFGELTDLPDTAPKSSYGMKHAESIMSFHIDLGPSMLGDILSVMEKSQWEQDLDSSLDELDGNRITYNQSSVPTRQTSSSSAIPSIQAHDHGSLSTNSRSHKSQPTKESHSVSRASSGLPGEKPRRARDFSFMDEEEDEDEIRV